MNLLHNDYLRKLQQEEKELRRMPMQNAALSATSYNHGFTKALNNLSSSNIQNALASQSNAAGTSSPIDPNTLPASAMELEALVDLFVARFGTAWVEVDNVITNDIFLAYRTHPLTRDA